MTEQTIQSSIIKYLKEEGWLVIKTIKLSENGYPDIFAFHEGHTIAIEVKHKTRPTPLQIRRIEQLTDKGVFAFIAHSLNEVKENLWLRSKKMSTPKYS